MLNITTTPKNNKLTHFFTCFFLLFGFCYLVVASNLFAQNAKNLPKNSKSVQQKKNNQQNAKKTEKNATKNKGQNSKKPSNSKVSLTKNSPKNSNLSNNKATKKGNNSHKNNKDEKTTKTNSKNKQKEPKNHKKSNYGKNKLSKKEVNLQNNSENKAKLTSNHKKENYEKLNKANKINADYINNLNQENKNKNSKTNILQELNYNPAIIKKSEEESSSFNNSTENFATESENLSQEKPIIINDIFFNEDEFSIEEQVNYQLLEISISNYLAEGKNHKSFFKIYGDNNPSRLIVEIKNGILKSPDYQPKLPKYVKNLKFVKEKNILKLVFELNQEVKINKKALRDFSNQNLQKIIIEYFTQKNIDEIKEKKSLEEDEKISLNDFLEKNYKNLVNIDNNENLSTKEILQIMSNKAIKNINQQNEIISKKNQQEKIALEKREIKNQKIAKAKNQKKQLVIVLDAGHGGKDPGTIGNFYKTQEKDLTLSYALALKEKLSENKAYKVVLTRDDDYFIPLKKRVEKARKEKADLFISLHLNWVDNEQTQGFSVYTLSEQSSDKQAQLLAQKENRADIISGINFEGANQEVIKTLIAMAQRSSMNNSSEFANLIIRIAKKSQVKILENTHRFAGFSVLTAPDMASILVELGYVSNKEEEEMLNQEEYRNKIIEVFVSAIDEYFSKISNI